MKKERTLKSFFWGGERGVKVGRIIIDICTDSLVLYGKMGLTEED